MAKDLGLYRGKVVEFIRDGKRQKAEIRKCYSTYALCNIGKKIDVVSYREIMEAVDGV